MTEAVFKVTRRNLFPYASAFGLLAGVGCAEKELPHGVFKQSEIANPKSLKQYRKSYTAPKNRFEKLEISHKGSDRIIFTHVPKGQVMTSVLLLLHGSNRTGASLIDKWRHLSEQNGIALIAPNSFSKRSWSLEHDNIEFMKKIVASVSESKGLSKLPIYGFGHSAGAIMMTHLSVRYGAYFTAVGAHAGNPLENQLVPYDKYKKPRAPLTHILGDRDHIFKTETAIAAGRRLAVQGQDVNLIIVKNHTHWYYDIARFVNDTAWASMTS